MRLTFMPKTDWSLSAFPSITQGELEKDFEIILQRIDSGEGPFVIRSVTGNSLVLIGWEDYWNCFGILYTDGERKRIEELCSKISEED